MSHDHFDHPAWPRSTTPRARSSPTNLTADGYRVLIAPDRAKALALLSTAHPDLILVDVNGETLELLDAIRSGEGLAGRVDPDTPLIVLSRDADRLQRIRVLERGGDDVVRKPFAYPELRARIAAVLRRSETAARRADPARGPDRDRRALARGARVRPAGRAVGEGVRPAGHARRRADPGVHPRGADARRLGAARRSGTPGRSTATRPGCGASCAATATDRLVINVWGVGYRLIDGELHRTQAGGGPMSDPDATPRSVVALYQQLAAERAGARAGGARARDHGRAAVRPERRRARGRRRRAAARRVHVHRARRAAARPVRRAGRRAARGRRAVRGGRRPDPRPPIRLTPKEATMMTNPRSGATATPTAPATSSSSARPPTATGTCSTSTSRATRRTSSTRSRATRTAARRPRRSPATT